MPEMVLALALSSEAVATTTAMLALQALVSITPEEIEATDHRQSIYRLKYTLHLAGIPPSMEVGNLVM